VGIHVLLSVLALLSSGVVAGVMVAVAISVVPALAAMPADRYVSAHQLLGRGYDPALPVTVVTATLLNAGFAVTADDLRHRVLCGAAALCLVGVSVVSHTRNVPLNRIVRRLDPARLPDNWQDPRPRWRAWHLVRTGLALAACALTALGQVLA
jgi:uncharacterized membrane protein